MDVGNDVLGIHDRSMRVYGEFGLETDCQKCECRCDRTYVEDMKDPVKVQPPGCDFFFVVLRMEKARNSTPFFQLANAPLDLCYRPGTKGAISKSCTTQTPAGLTHVASCSIASDTDQLS
jgi:hypothetical protein